MSGQDFDPSPVQYPKVIAVLLFMLALGAIVTKMFIRNSGGATDDFLIFANYTTFGLFWLVTIGWTIASALAKVRFTLGKMLAVVWIGSACVTCIVASSSDEIIALGVFGLVILTAYLIAGLARAGLGNNEGKSGET